MQLTEIDIGELADILEVSEELHRHDDQGSLIAHVLSHPTLGDVLAFQNANTGGGFLIQQSRPGESVHDFARLVPTLRF